MRSQCQFFMSSEDEAEFLAHATTAHPLVFSGEEYVAGLTCSLGSIQFLRSQSFGGILTAGRIALATTGLDSESLFPIGAADLECIYRQLRRWPQKRYANDLAAFNESFPPEQRKVVRYPSFWLGPRARGWLLDDPDRILKQFRTGNVVFKPCSFYATGVV